MNLEEVLWRLISKESLLPDDTKVELLSQWRSFSALVETLNKRELEMRIPPPEQDDYYEIMRKRDEHAEQMALYSYDNAWDTIDGLPPGHEDGFGEKYVYTRTEYLAKLDSEEEFKRLLKEEEEQRRKARRGRTKRLLKDTRRTRSKTILTFRSSSRTIIVRGPRHTS